MSSATPTRHGQIRSPRHGGLPVGRGPVRWQHPVLAALVALVVGTAATGAGAGIGVRYLQKTGLTATTVIGFALLATGLMLLGYAGVVAWRGLHRWWRLVLVPATLLVLVVAFAVSLSVAATVVPPTELGSSTPADQGLPYREVGFTTGDGVRLSGWFVPSRNGAAVVVMHGAGSTRTATLAQAGVLGRHGYGLLIVDARGHGRSGGRGMDFGWYGDPDTTAALGYLVRRPGVDPDRIGVLGLSMGGEEAVGAAAADPRIRAVVAEGVTARTAADRDTWLPGGVAGAITRGFDAMTYGFTDLLTPARPPTTLRTAVGSATGTSFLLVTAGAEPDEKLAAEALQGAAPERVDVWTVPDAAHTGGLAAAPVQWRQRVLAFLDQALGTRD
ncbi:alpha/beta hydrolase [Nocardioides mesophilus]|uniref:Alpha/beta hydrolase n=1 Tax=Nocardioides mesophilus TaxID=433659 RepID=A0A7G9RF98_9ACTN|nr:alpha/beta hydrolase [Nocardioides mesophilus]QNN54273.1 alpha/beta hydrolase [Nocardioides mesophilus]